MASPSDPASGAFTARRLAAKVIDWSLPAAGIGGSYLLMALLDIHGLGPFTFFMLVVIPGTILLVGIVQAVLLTNRGQSVGKIILGIWIVLARDPLRRPGFWRGAVLRSTPLLLALVLAAFLILGGGMSENTAVKVAVGAFLAVLLLDACFALGDESRCLHDHLAGTAVSRRRPEC